MQVIKSSRWCFLSSALALAVLNGAASAATWHVDQTNGDDGNDGETWGEAFETLQAGIAAATTAGDVILVAEGTYVPEDRTEGGDALSVTFLVNAGVTIRGGYPAGGGDQNPYANTTTLSGDLGGGSRAYHVLTAIDPDDDDTLVDGFVITMGEADGSDTNHHDLGGGLRMLAGTPGDNFITVQRCRFIGNDAEFGGAVGLRRNHAGADMFPVFVDCEFIDNESSDDGGAIHNFSADVVVSNSLFAGNISGNRGGGMFIENTCPSFPQCQGYPKSSATVYNSTFADNDADNRGGGLLVQNRSNLTITNAIFWDNTATNGSTEAQQIDMGMTDVTLDVDYTCVEGLSGISGTGNISSDPDFVGSGDYNLTEGSPAINTADPAILIDTPGYLQADSEDWDGDGYTGEPVPDVDVNKRVIGARIDMGAFSKPSKPVNRDSHLFSASRGCLVVLRFLARPASWQSPQPSAQ